MKVDLWNYRRPVFDVVTKSFYDPVDPASPITVHCRKLDGPQVGGITEEAQNLAKELVGIDENGNPKVLELPSGVIIDPLTVSFIINVKFLEAVQADTLPDGSKNPSKYEFLEICQMSVVFPDAYAAFSVWANQFIPGKESLGNALKDGIKHTSIPSSNGHESTQKLPLEKTQSPTPLTMSSD